MRFAGGEHCLTYTTEMKSLRKKILELWLLQTCVSATKNRNLAIAVTVKTVKGISFQNGMVLNFNCQLLSDE